MLPQRVEECNEELIDAEEPVGLRLMGDLDYEFPSEKIYRDIYASTNEYISHHIIGTMVRLVL